MVHRNKKAKLNRDRSHLKAMLGNMVTSLIEHEAIHTTPAKAKELRRTAESLITFAKRGDLHARRQVLRTIANKRIVAKLFDEIGPRYSNRNGGYTRIVKGGPRRGDGAEMCMIELVDRAQEAEIPLPCQPRVRKRKIKKNRGGPGSENRPRVATPRTGTRGALLMVKPASSRAPRFSLYRRPTIHPATITRKCQDQSPAIGSSSTFAT